ncbi:hypothetical protein Cob_v006871 [Colletotrichum orbiculare MAFF 240422]|uniref:Uncharacterized protein n=1 Tax=Colletotrichum orbiculare (strain 104-T / ATCC 96160 / CBS 514.97 / LARS 414 / MAFF 240422) TaxID=1213857 RepID=A0A484FMZ0_COLOR|nr:hypothetical protein Cob_v006871 [Colletotrichum orbiculare MAFF 240422]
MDSAPRLGTYQQQQMHLTSVPVQERRLQCIITYCVDRAQQGSHHSTATRNQLSSRHLGRSFRSPGIVYQHRRPMRSNFAEVVYTPRMTTCRPSTGGTRVTVKPAAATWEKMLGRAWRCPDPEPRGTGRLPPSHHRKWSTLAS